MTSTRRSLIPALTPVLAAAALMVTVAGPFFGGAWAQTEAQPNPAPTPGLSVPAGLTPPSEPPASGSGGGHSWHLPVSAGSGVGPLVLDFPAAGAGDPKPRATALLATNPFAGVIDSVNYFFSSLWSLVTSGLTPPSPASFAKTFNDKDPYSFWYMLGETGYKLKSIDTNIGFIPDVTFTFKYVRELSNGDITYLERKLEHHARDHQDLLSKIHRSIIYTLLEINGSDTYFVDTFKIDLLPLPKAEFSLEPWESGLPEEFDVLLRAIQGKDVTYRRSGREAVEGPEAK